MAARSRSSWTPLRCDGKLGRDRDGRYHLTDAQAGITGIVGDLYHDPNDGA